MCIRRTGDVLPSNKCNYIHSLSYKLIHKIYDLIKCKTSKGSIEMTYP